MKRGLQQGLQRGLQRVLRLAFLAESSPSPSTVFFSASLSEASRACSVGASAGRQPRQAAWRDPWRPHLRCQPWRLHLRCQLRSEPVWSPTCRPLPHLHLPPNKVAHGFVLALGPDSLPRRNGVVEGHHELLQRGELVRLGLLVFGRLLQPSLHLGSARESHETVAESRPSRLATTTLLVILLRYSRQLPYRFCSTGTCA